MLTIPSDLITSSASTTAQLISDFGVPLYFVLGMIIMFVIVPRVIGWVKSIGGKGTPKDKHTYTYNYKGQLTGGKK